MRYINLRFTYLLTYLLTYLHYLYAVASVFGWDAGTYAGVSCLT